MTTKPNNFKSQIAKELAILAEYHNRQAVFHENVDRIEGNYKSVDAWHEILTFHQNQRDKYLELHETYIMAQLYLQKLGDAGDDAAKTIVLKLSA